MEVEITSINDKNIDIKVTGFGEFDGDYGVSYDVEELDSTAIHNGRMYRFTHLMPLFVNKMAIHFFVKLWEDGTITVFCHVTNKDGDKVAEATGRA